MSRVTLVQNNWSAGELSPMLEGRIDHQAYRASSRTLLNMVPTRQGSLRRRPGTYYVGAPAQPSSYARLVEYEDVYGNAYILEFSSAKLRCWKSNGKAQVGTDQTSMPWSSETIVRELRVLCHAGMLWVVHHTFAPRNVTVTGGAYGDPPTAGTTLNVTIASFTGKVTFASSSNYPSAIGYVSGRLVLGGTQANPTMLYLSRPPDSVTGIERLTNFGRVSDSTSDVSDYIAISMSGMSGTTIKWVMGAQGLVVGTSRHTWCETQQSKPTPADFNLRIAGYDGAAAVQAVQAENVAAYVAASGQSVRILAYALEGGGYEDIDLTKLCSHLLSSPAKEVKVTTSPEHILWIVREDGVLAAITFDFKEGVVGAARHILGNGADSWGGGTQAKVESVAVARGTTEELWMVVNRSGTRTIEYLTFADDATTDDLHYVDCGKELSPASKEVTVSWIADGKTVSAVGDGAALPDKVVASGKATYDRNVASIHIGYPYESQIDTERPEVPASGTSQGKRKRIEKVSLRVYRTLGGSAGPSLSALEEIPYLVPGSDRFGIAPSLYSGDIDIRAAGTVTTDGFYFIRQTRPLPFNLLAIFTGVDLMEA